MESMRVLIAEYDSQELLYLRSRKGLRNQQERIEHLSATKKREQNALKKLDKLILTEDGNNDMEQLMKEKDAAKEKIKDLNEGLKKAEELVEKCRQQMDACHGLMNEKKQLIIEAFEDKRRELSFLLMSLLDVSCVAKFKAWMTAIAEEKSLEFHLTYSIGGSVTEELAKQIRSIADSVGVHVPENHKIKRSIMITSTGELKDPK